MRLNEINSISEIEQYILLNLIHHQSGLVIERYLTDEIDREWYFKTPIPLIWMGQEKSKTKFHSCLVGGQGNLVDWENAAQNRACKWTLTDKSLKKQNWPKSLMSHGRFLEHIKKIILKERIQNMSYEKQFVH